MAKMLYERAVIQSQVIDPDVWVPSSESDRELVRAQLIQIMESTHFCSSKRYPTFLSFIVERQLAGHGDELKERTIGIELFGRELTYDTNADPIVRVTAAEVRKRLNQYYSQRSQADDLRICVSSGSYVPYFKKPTSVDKAIPAPGQTLLHEPTLLPDLPSDPTPEVNARSESRSSFSRWLWSSALILAVAALGAGVVDRHWNQRQPSPPTDPAMTEFWKPFADYHGTVLVSFGAFSMMRPSLPAQPSPDMAMVDAIQHYNILALPSAVALSKISGVLGEQHIRWRVENADLTSFDDVQAGPTILIGAFHNQWTLRLTSGLRFSFKDSPTASRIVDSHAQQQPDWVLYREKPYSTLVQDYGVIAHYRDSTTGKLVVIAAGIGTNGTMAAGDFITNEQSLEELMHQAPKNWGHENVEAVITTQVINGKSGPPRLVAAQFW
jgi:hypothetical protein